MKKNILLVNPQSIVKSPNVGLAFLNNSLIKNKFRTEFFDLNLTDKKYPELDISKFDFVLVSVSSYSVNSSIEFSSRFRPKSKAVFICGGSFLNLDYNNFKTLKDHFHYGIAGNAEETLIELLNSIIHKKKSNKICGLIYFRGNKLIYEKKSEIGNKTPFVDYPVYEAKAYDYFRKNTFTYPFITSRGCPYKCVFCPNPMLQGKIWRAKSPKNVLKEIEYIYKVHKINTFTIMDDNFSLDRNRAKQILRLIIKQKYNLRFELGNGIRADTVDDELACLLKQSNCVRIPIGVENADEETFKFVKKGESLDTIRNALRILKKRGLNVEAYVIIGLINVDKDSLIRALNFIKKEKVLARWAIAMPLPNTEFYDWVKENGRFIKTEETQGTWSSKPPVMFESKFLNKKELLYYFYFLNSEVENFLFLGYGKANLNRLFVTLYNVLKYNPKKLPNFLRWCIMSAIYGKDYALNRINTY